MGLDMYLYRRTYVGYNFEHVRERNRLEIEGEHFGNLKAERVSHITEQVAYWRKANAIHNWFVENVQNGVDDCNEYKVTYEQLKILLQTVEWVLAAVDTIEGDVETSTVYTSQGVTEHFMKGRVITNPEVIEKLLPTKGGFFFGSTDYNEWFLQDMEQTRDQLRALLDESDEADEFTYQSSW